MWLVSVFVACRENWSASTNADIENTRHDAFETRDLIANNNVYRIEKIHILNSIQKYLMHIIIRLVNLKRLVGYNNYEHDSSIHEYIIIEEHVHKHLCRTIII